MYQPQRKKQNKKKTYFIYQFPFIGTEMLLFNLAYCFG